MDTEADGLVTEIFVLHPEGYVGPSRIARGAVAHCRSLRRES